MELTLFFRYAAMVLAAVILFYIVKGFFSKE